MANIVSYAGVALAAPTPAQEAKIARWIPVRDTFSFDRLAFPGWNRAHWAFSGNVPHHPQIVLNRLYWPVGASRWAFGHYLVDGDSLATIRESANASGLLVAQPLAFYDGTNTLEADMLMLPARPLAQTTVEAENLYLLTLVDARFFWWASGDNLTIDPEEDTWEDVYIAVGDVLGVTIEVDTIDAAYLAPPRDFAARYEYLPLLLDAVAFSVGQRIVRRFDGTVAAQNPDTALGLAQLQMASVGDKIGGGVFSW